MARLKLWHGIVLCLIFPHLWPVWFVLYCLTRPL